jgi:hypothetical protein
VDVLAPVTVFAEALVEEGTTGFGFVLEVELLFFSDFILVVGKGTLS